MGNNITVIGKIQDHELSYDKRQFILNHPAGCPFRGCSSDKGRTYSGYWVIEESLAECGLRPTGNLFEQIKAIQEEHQRTKCGYFPPSRKTVNA